MKQFLLFAALCCLGLSHGLAQVEGTPIFNWDFSEGIPSNWENGIISTNNIAHWEYRGPATEPDVTVGARGSCSAIAQPISSETASNGYVIFDSNYWDDDDDACGNLGTGQDPAGVLGHTAWLTTQPLDLSAQLGTVLTFQQQFRHFQSTTKVQVSNDGGETWIDVITNPATQSAQVEWASVNISTYTQGQTDVRIRFLFTGTYYWWILDDITIYEPNPNDLKNARVRYGTNQGIGSSQPYNDLEYDQYPVTMIPPFNFKSVVQNIGAFQQTGVQLNTTIIKDGTTQTYTANSAAINLASGASTTLSITPAYTQPANLGEYNIIYTIDQNEVDDNPVNNVDSLDYTISSYTYARDEGPMEIAFSPDPVYNGYTYEAGNFFQSRTATRVFHSVGVALAEGTMPGAQIKGIIYKVDMEEVWAETEVYTVNVADLNEPGEEKIVNIPLLNDIVLKNDSIYLVMIRQLDASQPMSIARSGNAPEEMSIVRYPEINATFYFLKTPVVRMNIFNAADIPGCNDLTASNYDPAATIFDGTCLYPGCSFDNADNYDPSANFDDGSCIIAGCMDPVADNYDPYATYSDNSCQYIGCTNPEASNYDPTALDDDGTCLFLFASLEVDAPEGCAPHTAAFQTQTSFEPGSSCVFTVNDVVIIEDCVSNFYYTFNEPGNFVAGYTYINGTDTTYDEVNITVFESGVLGEVTYNSTTNTVECPDCAGDELQWILDGESIDGAQSTIHSIFQDGVYENGYYSINMSDDNGCILSSDPLLVIEAYFSVSADGPCTPVQLTWTNLTDEIEGMYSTLNFGEGEDVINPADIESHVYTVAGEYEITYTVVVDETLVEYSSIVQVDETLFPVLEVDGEEVICTNCSEFESVEWEINGDTFTGSGPFPVQDGLFIVTGTTEEGCDGSAQLVVDNILDGLFVAVNIYPNPATSSLWVSGDKAINAELLIYNATGSLVIQQYISRETLYHVDLSGLVQGLYEVVLLSENERIVKQVQVVR